MKINASPLLLSAYQVNLENRGAPNEFASTTQIETGHIYSHYFNGCVGNITLRNELFF
jgi:hypothetical protein